MGHQTRIYVFQNPDTSLLGYGINIPEKRIPSMNFFERREDKHIKLSFIIHENTVALSQKINGIYIPENLVWYPHGSPTHVQKCEWVAVPYFRGSFILQCSMRFVSFSLNFVSKSRKPR